MTSTRQATSRVVAQRRAYNRYQYARARARREYEAATAEANAALASSLDEAIAAWNADLARVDREFPPQPGDLPCGSPYRVRPGLSGRCPAAKPSTERTHRDRHRT